MPTIAGPRSAVAVEGNMSSCDEEEDAVVEIGIVVAAVADGERRRAADVGEGTYAHKRSDFLLDDGSAKARHLRLEMEKETTNGKVEEEAYEEVEEEAPKDEAEIQVEARICFLLPTSF
nr:hypothetical protein Iba_chr08aCG9600 [Ipomoea batatas]